MTTIKLNTQNFMKEILKGLEEKEKQKHRKPKPADLYKKPR